jgi:hypothetical protein
MDGLAASVAQATTGLGNLTSTAAGALHGKLEAVLDNQATILIDQASASADPRPGSHGFRVSSQFDEDGIIQFLIRKVEIPNEVFIEFGVEDYTESNTRFLLTHDNWSGLVLDSSEEQVARIKGSDLYWRHNLKADCALVDRDNINGLFAAHGLSGDIGILSIDVDGIDYWLWDACTQVDPRIVIIEYNSIFGNRCQVTVPYDPSFDRAKKHYSHLYAGASLPALVALGQSKGYSLVASNKAGNNAFFVRNDCMGNLSPISTREGYVKAQFRESRDPEGRMTYLPIEEAVELIFDQEVMDVSSGTLRPIGDLEISYD